jgi:hypothetical protein
MCNTPNIAKISIYWYLRINRRVNVMDGLSVVDLLNVIDDRKSLDIFVLLAREVWNVMR